MFWLWLLGAWLFFFQELQAQVFNLPHLIPPGSFAVGVEPHFFMTPRASWGGDVRYVQGISEISNATFILGGASSGIRWGANSSFDIIPDLPDQMGFGFAVEFFRVSSFTCITGIPYVHKTFAQGLEPFLAFPLGWSLREGRYGPLSSLVVGTYFDHSSFFKTVFEFGMGLQGAGSYLSVGVLYYH
jgi:hypothetical protein